MIVLTSATTASILTIKPETPKAVFVKEYRMESDVVAAVRKYTKAGYIVKSCNGAGSGVLNATEKDTIKQQLGCQSMNDLDFLTYIRQNSLHRKFMTLLGM